VIALQPRAARAVVEPGQNSTPYLVGAMMTPSHAQFGERLSASCRAHSLPLDSLCSTQLLCSGAVQWWNRTAPAFTLLERWQRVIERSVGSADDKCLDHAFNNFPGDAPLRAAWLPKSYARIAWWIYEQPFIDHPEIPARAEGFVPLDELDGRRRIYTQWLKEPEIAPVFPKDCLIDTQTRTLLRLSDRVWRPVARFSTPLWL
jgi:hypothetical protein